MIFLLEYHKFIRTCFYSKKPKVGREVEIAKQKFCVIKNENFRLVLQIFFRALSFTDIYYEKGIFHLDCFLEDYLKVTFMPIIAIRKLYEFAMLNNNLVTIAGILCGLLLFSTM